MCLREQSVLDADYPFGEGHECIDMLAVFSWVGLLFGFSLSFLTSFYP